MYLNFSVALWYLNISLCISLRIKMGNFQYIIPGDGYLVFNCLSSSPVLIFILSLRKSIFLIAIAHKVWTRWPVVRASNVTSFFESSHKEQELLSIDSRKESTELTGHVTFYRRRDDILLKVPFINRQ